ncbi:MAG: hypothetical protein NVSMB3_14310 [Acidobacteriaceae bacterium]
MLGSPILDVAVGMAFIYLVLSLIASVVQEILASLVQSRPANLYNGIRSLLSGNTDLLTKLYSHGLIAGLYRDPDHDFGGKGGSTLTRLRGLLQPVLGVPLIGIGKENKLPTTDPLLLPAYIPSRTFALALIDLLNEQHTAGDAAMGPVAFRIQQKIEDPGTDQIEVTAYKAIQALALRSGGRLDAFQANLENWYNDGMDRVSGWYKKYTQNLLLVIGLLIAILFNVDSVRVARTLWFDRDARAGLVSAANDYLQKHPAAQTGESGAESASCGKSQESNPKNKAAGENQTPANPDPESSGPSAAAPAKAPDFQELECRLNGTVNTFNQVSGTLLLPLGWRHSFAEYGHALASAPQHTAWQILTALLGWIVTALALSLGAPFWFDILNRFMVVRNTVKPQEKSQTDKSKDHS